MRYFMTYEAVTKEYIETLTKSREVVREGTTASRADARSLRLSRGSNTVRLGRLDPMS